MILNHRQLQKTIKYLLFLFSLIFVIGYTVIAYNNVYYGDDLHFIDLIRKYGWVNVSKNVFFHFECPLTLPLNLALLYASSLAGGVFTLNIFILLTNIFALFLFLNKLWASHLSRIQIFALSTFIVSLMYSCTRSVGQLGTVFWADGQLPYVLAMSYLFLWLYFFLRYKTGAGKLNLHMLGSMCFILMNTKLNYCLFFLTYLSAGILLDFIFSKNVKISGEKNPQSFMRYLIALIKKKENLILLAYAFIGLAFYVLNPGNFDRMKFDGQTHVSVSPLEYLKAILIGQKHFYLMIVTSRRFLIVLILIAVFVVTQVKIKIDSLLRRQALLIHFIAFSVALTLQTLLFKAVFGTAIYQGRIFFLSEFLFLLLFAHCIYYFYHQYFPAINLKTAYIISIPVLLLLLTAELFYFYKQINVVTTFKHAHDNRIALLTSEKLKNRTEPLYLDKLPQSGVIEAAEISVKEQMHDSSVYYENKRLENFYDLPYKIYLKNQDINLNQP